MNLALSIVGNPLGWKTILDQEGIPWDQALPFDEREERIAIVATQVSDAGVRERLRAHIAGGGGIVCSASIFAQLYNVSLREKEVRYLLPDGFFPAIKLVDIDRSCGVLETANALPCEDGSPTAFVGPYGGGHAVVLPFDPALLAVDYRTSVRSFLASHRRLPFERVRRVNQGGIRRIVSRSVEILFHSRDLPFIRLSASPRASSLFCFRVDTDHALPADIERLENVVSDNGVQTTWFVDVQSQRSRLRQLGERQYDEIGLHCFDHMYYSSYEQARNDIQVGKEILATDGIQPGGFAAPYGVWDKAVGKAIEDSGFAYSSEFHFDFDNLPSLPHVDGTTFETMEVPVHPISIGNLRRQGFRSDEMVTYFKELVEERLASGEPLLLYHHPKDGYESVLAKVFQLVRELGIPSMTMHNFVRWWKRRAEQPLRAHLDGTTMQIRSAPGGNDVFVALTRPDGSVATSAAKGSVNLDDLPWNVQHARVRSAVEYKRIRRPNPWIPVIRVEDFIYKHVRTKIWGK